MQTVTPRSSCPALCWAGVCRSLSSVASIYGVFADVNLEQQIVQCLLVHDQVHAQNHVDSRNVFG